MYYIVCHIMIHYFFSSFTLYLCTCYHDNTENRGKGFTDVFTQSLKTRQRQKQVELPRKEMLLMLGILFSWVVHKIIYLDRETPVEAKQTVLLRFALLFVYSKNNQTIILFSFSIYFCSRKFINAKRIGRL